MEKIVQLRESEYDKLFQLANMSEKQIQEEVEKRWKNCPAKIDVNVRINNDWDDIFKIKCYTYLTSYPLEIPYEAKKKLNDIIQKHFRKCVEEHFGKAEEVINDYRNKSKRMKDALLLLAFFFTALGGLMVLTAMKIIS